MSKDKSAPAFPTIMRDEDGYISGRGHGMTLRDYFAGQAVQGWIIALSRREGQPGYDDHGAAHEAVRLAYVSADVMLAEREK